MNYLFYLRVEFVIEHEIIITGNYITWYYNIGIYMMRLNPVNNCFIAYSRTCIGSVHTALKSVSNKVSTRAVCTLKRQRYEDKIQIA